VSAVDLLLAVPLLTTTAMYARCRFRGRPACLWHSIDTGWPLPTALAYAVLSGWPRGTVTTLWDEVPWRASLVFVFAPQTVVLLALGIIGIACRRDGPNRALALAIILVTLAGHIWTRYLTVNF